MKVLKNKPKTLSKDVDYRIIPGFNEYCAGNDGSIWHIKRSRTKFPLKLSIRKNKDGGYIVSLLTDTQHVKHVKDLVYVAFYNIIPDKYKVININYDKSDNSLSNLKVEKIEKEEMSNSVEYRDILDFPNYKVGDDGSVWSNKVKYFGYETVWHRLTPSADGGGKLFVYLSNEKLSKPKMKKVHRLVLENFIGPCPDGMEGCHNNGKAIDNRLTNLRWDTHVNNEADKLIHDTHVRGARNGNSKLKQDEVIKIKTLLKNSNSSLSDIGAMFNISKDTIWRIKQGSLWGWLEVQ